VAAFELTLLQVQLGILGFCAVIVIALAVAFVALHAERRRR
jgi:hypothetical protein